MIKGQRPKAKDQKPKAKENKEDYCLKMKRNV